MTSGQRVTFEYHGNNYIFTVNQAVVEGQKKSSAPERGIICNDTYIVFETSSASGIKVTFFFWFINLLVFCSSLLWFMLLFTNDSLAVLYFHIGKI